MKHVADEGFWKAYDVLPAKVRKQADKAFDLLNQNPNHPSLHFKKIGRRWSVRVDRGYRALALEIEGGLLWYWIGSHDQCDRMIG